MRIPAVVAIVGCVALLAGCAVAPAADPMSDELRAGIQQQRADQAWRVIAEEYPEAHRPDVAVGPVVPDFDWLAESANCYRQHGIEVTESGGGLSYKSSSGASQIDFAVTQYECDVQVVMLGEVVRSLDDFQLGALYDFYVTKLRPCLEFSGVQTSDPPARDDFIIQVYATLWSPYDAVIATNPDADALAALVQRCPPVPSWLHL